MLPVIPGIQPQLLRRILYVGVPAGLQFITFDLANVLIQSGVNSFGDVTIAAWTAYVKTDALTWQISGAFGVSITTFVGQNFGAQKYSRIRKSVWVCMGMSVSLIALLSAVVLLLRNWILGIYTTDPEVIRVGAYVMLWIVHRRYHAGNRIFHHAYRHHLRMCLCIPGSLDFPSGQPVAHCGNAGPGIPCQLGSVLHCVFHCLFPGRLAAKANCHQRNGSRIV